MHFLPCRHIPALLCGAIFAALLLVVSPARGQNEGGWTTLDQSADAVLAHQRLPGNARAQAKRRGVIRTVPHLFVFHRDGTPAFHMDGLRPGFERQLDLLIDAFRIDRSMVELETLLANAETVDGEPVTRDDLTQGRITLVLYTRDECGDCDAVRERVEAWLAEHGRVDTNRLEVRMP